MNGFLDGDIVLTVAMILIFIVIVLVIGMIAYRYHVIYVRTEIEESLNEAIPNRKHYLVTRSDRKRLLSPTNTEFSDNIPIYEGPSDETSVKTYLDPTRVVTSKKYEVGYYYIGQFGGWVSRSDVKVISRNDMGLYPKAVSINYNKHKFSVVITDENAQIHVSPDFVSRVKFTKEDNLIEINREYFSDMYNNNWYYISEFGGWVHEGSIRAKCLY